MSLTPRERMQRALALQPVDRLPTQINYTRSMGERLSAHLGAPFASLPERLGNHLLRLEVHFTPSAASQSAQANFDWWGVGWSPETEGYWPIVQPLAENPDLQSFAWPDPHTSGMLDEAKRLIVADGGQHFTAPNFGFALYERAWSLRGFEQFNMDLALNPGYAEELLDRITHIQEALARRFVVLGVDGGYFGDDYGAQKGMLLSPRLWRTLFKPRLARLFAVFRQAGLPVILHSDGDIAPILPDLVEIGLTALNPVQPEVLDFAWLKATFGDRLAFYGGVSTQTVLPHGSPAEVRQAVRQTVDTLASNGTGLLLGPSHRMTSDIPLENVDALLEAISMMENRR